MNTTNYYINNIMNIIKKTDQDALKSRVFNKRFINYNIYMGERLKILRRKNYNFNEVLTDDSFCSKIIKMLRNFQMDQRGSVLMTKNDICDALCHVANYFHILYLNNINLESLNLRSNINESNVNSYIKKTFDYLCLSNVISQSGGIVIASKTMHFIMPEIFIMIDNRVMKSLHNISDYYPKHNEPFEWYNELINYEGQKLNPYQGTWNWSKYICYAGVLIYYKRIINEWCQINNSNIKGFLKNDRLSAVPYASRIIDKIFW